MKVLVADSMAESGIERLRAEVTVDVRTKLSEQQLIDIIGEYDALVVRSQTQVTANIINAGTKLKVIGRAGVGINNIDVEAATNRGIVVVNVPDGNTLAAAEHTMGMMLALARQIPQANDSLKGGAWDRKKFMGIELCGKVLGLVGIGRIGSEVARRARAFRMEVLAYDPFVSAEQANALDVQLVDLPELIRRADVISIHSPLTRETKGMIGEQELAAMKDGVRIVNCARGGIVDEDCLVAALKSGKVAGAALDVFSQEPVTNHPLFSLPNVVVTPHLGASTYEAQDYNSMAIAEQVLKVLHGQPVENAVNLPMVAPEEWQTLARYLPMAEILGRCFAQSGVRSIDTLHLLFEGELAALPTALLTNTVLKGVLAEVVSEPVNHINAALIAKRRGIKVIESRSSNGSGYRQRMVLKSESEPDRQVGVTLGPAGETRIIDVHGYRLDLVPEQHMILAPHTDKPGIIGKVGSTIGNYGINIAAMQVGRRAVGGPAVMALVLDDAATDEILEQVKAVDGIKDARRVELPESLVKQG